MSKYKRHYNQSPEDVRERIEMTTNPDTPVQKKNKNTYGDFYLLWGITLQDISKVPIMLLIIKIHIS